jgi:mRNA interferase MazF
VPNAGDVVWLQFSPQASHKQASHRPAVVLTQAGNNRASGMMICMPMNTQIKGYPF